MDREWAASKGLPPSESTFPLNSSKSIYLLNGYLLVGLSISRSHDLVEIAAICSHMRYAQQEKQQSEEAIYVWVSHQQMAPQTNSSLSEPEHFFPPSHACT